MTFKHVAPRLYRSLGASGGRAVLLRLLAEQPEVRVPVVVDEEHVLAIVPPLGDVVRATRDHDSSDARHGPIVPFGVPVVNGE